MNAAIALKVLGSILTASGSILLAFRLKILIQKLVEILVFHENNFDQINNVLKGMPQDFPIINGSVKSALSFQDKIGYYLLFAGFLSLGSGAILTAISLIVK